MLFIYFVIDYSSDYYMISMNNVYGDRRIFHGINIGISLDSESSQSLKYIRSDRLNIKLISIISAY